MKRYTLDFFGHGVDPEMKEDDEGPYVLFRDVQTTIPDPVNPDATARLAAALRAIVDYYGYVGYFLTDKHIEDANNALHMAQLPIKLTEAGERIAPIQGDPPCGEYDESGEGTGLEFDGFSQCANCGHAKSFHKQLPVVPVSEDVHLRLGPCRCHDCARARSEDVETIRKELQNDPLWMEFQTTALAALDRLEKGARK